MSIFTDVLEKSDLTANYSQDHSKSSGCFCLTLSWKGRVTDVSEKSAASILRVEVRRKEDSYFPVY